MAKQAQKLLQANSRHIVLNRKLFCNFVFLIFKPLFGFSNSPNPASKLTITTGKNFLRGNHQIQRINKL